MLALYSLDTFCIKSLSYVNQIHLAIPVVCWVTVLIHPVGFSRSVTAVHFDGLRCIAYRVNKSYIYKEVIKDTQYL